VAVWEVRLDESLGTRVLVLVLVSDVVYAR